ncbi:hypothetical protein CCUS01_09650 [Colletotrichum cuscutae]|uniref:Uncharacterized protein n=1 Tax=Colletotrichum cuscutae TaxID=1209917 RepID=A0AAI9UFM5_9PEZI|nr:hypothetical protein CCUS01_09650 [Colletotrichum cuscutae]
MLLPNQDPLGVHPHHPPLSLAPPYHITDVTTIPNLLIRDGETSRDTLPSTRRSSGRYLILFLELLIPALYLVVYARSPVELTPIISALADLLSTDRLNLGCLLQPTHTISFECLRRFHMHLAEAI